MQNANVMPDDVPTGTSRRSRTLAGATRARLLARLREAAAPLSLRELATGLGLHPSSVREQLGHLVEDGSVRIVRSRPSGRGRPALLYVAAPVVDPVAPYRELARALADELATDLDRLERSVGAGERWGSSLVGEERGAAPSVIGPEDARARLISLLEAGGFAPESSAADATIRLRRCPFAPLAAEHADVVCGVHLGFMRGALARLGAPFDGVRLEPFVEPGLCLAHLGPVPDTAPQTERPRS
jgi:predicted ArsR family transcriptional regulator